MKKKEQSFTTETWIILDYYWLNPGSFELTYFQMKNGKLHFTVCSIWICVLEFAFDTRDTDYGYLPHCYTRNCIVYTGTHDNETINGWFETAPEEDTSNAIRYLRLTKKEGYHWGMMGVHGQAYLIQRSCRCRIFLVSDMKPGSIPHQR